MKSNGLHPTTISPAGDWLSVKTNITQANKLLGTEYQVFNYTGGRGIVIQTLSYSIPVDLAGHVETIHPTTAFLGARHSDASFAAEPITTPSTGDSKGPLHKRGTGPCPSCATPSSLQKQYQIPKTPAKQPHNSIGVLGFLGEYALNNTKDYQVSILSHCMRCSTDPEIDRLS